MKPAISLEKVAPHHVTVAPHHRTGAVLAVLLGGVLALAAQAQTTFNARVSAQLCPEYPDGSVTVAFKYAAGSAAPTAAELLSTSIDSSSNTGVFDLRLPATFGVTPLNITGYCANSFGQGSASNILSVSYCDALELRDSDNDGISDADEDSNCNGSFDAGDKSDFFAKDTDGDGDLDSVEKTNSTDPLSSTSGSKPLIHISAPFDPDGDGNSNLLTFRPTSQEWFISDFPSTGLTHVVRFGNATDIPFVYQPLGARSDLGVIRTGSGSALVWTFRGKGLVNHLGNALSQITFGIAGDRIMLGPWETAGMTSPAIARIRNNQWQLVVYLRDGTAKSTSFGTRTDILVPADYDGDGLFDIAYFRPSAATFSVTRSSDGGSFAVPFGSNTSLPVASGDVTGDGRADLTVLNPSSGLFESVTSDGGFDGTRAAAREPGYYQSLSLGTPSNTTAPLRWNTQSGKALYTLINGANGVRATRAGNLPGAPAVQVQWGLPGDIFG